MRCCRLCFLLTLGLSSTSFRPDYSLSRVASAAWDVLSNFLRLSISSSFVNYILHLSSTSSKIPNAGKAVRSAKYQNTVTLVYKKQARSTQLLELLQINCSGLGLDCRSLKLSTAIKRLDCAPSSLVSALKLQGPRCEAIFLATHLEYPAFRIRASFYAFHFVSG